MNITEANHVQFLLDWVLGLEKPSGGYWTDEQAREMAAYLADRSYKVLSAGMTGVHVHASWPGRSQRS